MDGEPDPATASLELALFWRGIYTEILTMEESVLERIRQLMAAQSRQARREVELTNVPVVVAQADRFRVRLGFWEARVGAHQQPSPNSHPPLLPLLRSRPQTEIHQEPQIQRLRGGKPQRRAR